MPGHDIIGVILGPSLFLPQLPASLCALPIFPHWISQCSYVLSPSSQTLIFHPGLWMLTELTSTNNQIRSLQISIFSLRAPVLGHTTPENQRARALRPAQSFTKPAGSYVLLLPATTNHVSKCHRSTYCSRSS